MTYVHDVEGVEQETVEIRMRLGRAGFDKLRFGSVKVKEVFLTEQPDGSFALGVVTPDPPETQGYQARKVERDDRRERFGGEPEPWEYGPTGEGAPTAGAFAPETEA